MRESLGSDTPAIRGQFLKEARVGGRLLHPHILADRIFRDDLGHFLLVNLLLDAVSAGGRIVFTASGTHDPESMDGKMAGGAVEPDAQALALDGKNGVKPISGGKRYATSKLCVILFAYELDRRLRHSQSSLASIAFDPGQIPETGLGRTYPAVVRWLSTFREQFT